MVKVIYAPPHRDAPFTHQSMPGYGPRLGQETRFTLWLAKQPQFRVILSAVGITMAICAIPQTVRERFYENQRSFLFLARLELSTNTIILRNEFFVFVYSSFLTSFHGQCLRNIKPPTVHICVTTT